MQTQAGGPAANAIRELVSRESGKPSTVDFGLFWDVWDALNEKYVDKGKIDTQKLVYGAIQGMVNSVGDPYTVFFQPATSKKFRDEISGSFGGVGMEISKRNNVLTVVAPLKDTPAFKAGIKAGDRILKIGAKPTADLSVEEAVDLIRGPRGTTVTITIAPASSNTTKDITMTRENIKVPAVDWKLIDGHVAYISIYEFSQNVDSEFKKAVQEALAAKADRIVIDLRNNPGGLLDSAVNLSGWFLDKNSLVTTEDFANGTKNEFRTSGDGQLKKYPTVVLINGGSASASEILSGALRDNRGIKLIGEKSFGKGSVQELQNFSDGSSLKVTIAKWLTPHGISISEKGINPDIEVKLDPKAIEAEEVTIGEPGKDPQLDKALEVVKGL